MTVVKKGEQKYNNNPVFMAGFTTANPHLLEKNFKNFFLEQE